jgi:hypothetical protein
LTLLTALSRDCISTALTTSRDGMFFNTSGKD